MGLNDFVALFYGSAQNLQTTAAVAQTDIQMFRNRKNSLKLSINNNEQKQKQKQENIHLSEFPTLQTNETKLKNLNPNYVASNLRVTLTQHQQKNQCRLAAQQAASSYSDLDLYRGPAQRKKSFIWNSFRMPRRQKGGESEYEITKVCVKSNFIALLHMSLCFTF